MRSASGGGHVGHGTGRDLTRLQGSLRRCSEAAAPRWLSLVAQRRHGHDPIQSHAGALEAADFLVWRVVIILSEALPRRLLDSWHSSAAGGAGEMGGGQAAVGYPVRVAAKRHA